MTEAHPTTHMALPLTAEAITATWLTEALSLMHPGTEVQTMAIMDVLSGASTKYRVRVTYNDAGRAAGLPEQFIVKGGFEEHSASMEFMYLLEMQFYRDAASHMDINAPRCFYAGCDPDTYQSIVIIEDLTLRGVTFFDAYRTQTYEQVANRLRAMAKYHAQTWDSTEFADGGRLDWVPSRYGSPLYLERMEQYLSADVWARFMKLPRAAATPKPLRDRDWMRGALEKLIVEHARSPVCLIHGDCHLGNVYEEADGTPGFLDPQLSRAPWSMEVAYHMVGAFEVADRRKWERPLVAFYLECLRSHGVDPPKFEDAWDAYRRDICHGLYIWLENEPVFQEESINTANASRFGAAAIDCGTFERLS